MAGQQGSGVRERHHRFVGRVLPRFHQDDKCLPPGQRGARARVGGLSWCRTIRRSGSHLVFGSARFSSPRRSRIGTRLDRSRRRISTARHDLGCVQGIERMAGESQAAWCPSAAAGLPDPCPLCGALPLAFPPAAAPAHGPKQLTKVYRMTCLTCVSSAAVCLEGHDCFIGAFGPEILAGPLRRFGRLCSVDARRQ